MTVRTWKFDHEKKKKRLRVRKLRTVDTSGVEDGVYQITARNDYFTAGYVVKAGEVEMCAPILKERLRTDFEWWHAKAKKVA